MRDRISTKMDKNSKPSLQLSTDGMCSSQCSEISKSDRVIHDAELGEENVELVDSEWADFERALRYVLILWALKLNRFS